MFIYNGEGDSLRRGLKQPSLTEEFTSWALFLGYTVLIESLQPLLPFLYFPAIKCNLNRIELDLL